MLMYGRFLAKVVVALALVCTDAAAFAEDAPKTPGAGDDYVWHWSKRCRNPKWIAAAVVLDDRTVYTSTIPLCRVKRADILSGQTQSMLTFVLRDRTRSLFGESIGTQIEGNIWEAGSESGAVTLGISASENGRVLLNTLHSANPNSAVASAIAHGLTIKTYPKTSPQQNSSAQKGS